MFVLKFFGTFCTFFRFRPATPNLIKLWKAFLRGVQNAQNVIFLPYETQNCARVHTGATHLIAFWCTHGKFSPYDTRFILCVTTRILISYRIFCVFLQKSAFHQAIRYRFLTENKFDVFGAQARSTYRMHKYVIWTKSCFFRSMTFETSGCNF